MSSVICMKRTNAVFTLSECGSLINERKRSGPSITDERSNHLGCGQINVKKKGNKKELNIFVIHFK